jgi:hypothetical protein
MKNFVRVLVGLSFLFSVSVLYAGSPQSEQPGTFCAGNILRLVDPDAAAHL